MNPANLPLRGLCKNGLQTGAICESMGGMTEAALSMAAARAGGRSALARLLGISRQAVEQWREVPALRVLQVERCTGVPRTHLRPDLYPVEFARTEARA
jgi:DNA-binding transcriptional regulator YdaS (Cro superfamily)